MRFQRKQGTEAIHDLTYILILCGFLFMILFAPLLCGIKNRTITRGEACTVWLICWCFGRVNKNVCEKFVRPVIIARPSRFTVDIFTLETLFFSGANVNFYVAIKM